MPAQSIFQSTLPARGATWQTCSATGFQIFQSTLPARGATVLEQTREIKVTAFQSTLPARGATCRALDVYGRRGAISIHAPRTGSDMRREIARLSDEDFNPRSPHGERRRRCFNRPGKSIFQSTLPARGATFNAYETINRNRISIHAPRTGSDLSAKSTANPPLAFQSTLPARGATSADGVFLQHSPFQSTLPARGATAPPKHGSTRIPDFNPRSPHGERHVVQHVAYI